MLDQLISRYGATKLPATGDVGSPVLAIKVSASTSPPKVRGQVMMGFDSGTFDRGEVAFGEPRFVNSLLNVGVWVYFPKDLGVDIEIYGRTYRIIREAEWSSLMVAAA